MRIQDRTAVEGGGERITLVPETLDDLWHLHYVIEPGDLVSGETTRRIQRDDDQMRDTGGQREHVGVTLAVDDVEFHRFANRLRVSGTIESASREDVIGAHHTLNVEEREEIQVQKHWKPDQLQRLDEAVEATEEPDVAIATVEEGSASIYTVAQFGVEERTTFTGTTGKGEYAQGREGLFVELADALARMDVDAIILAGPGFTKQDAYDHIEAEHPDLPQKISMVDTSAGGGRGVHEVLTRGAVDDVRENTRVAREAELIDELMENVATGAKATYGPEDVAEAAEFGAIETLLILDERLRQERGPDGDWVVDVDAVVESVEQQGGDVVVFSHEFDPGQQLRNLGGIAGILRYRLQ